jgi:hypothetical protein
MQDAKYDAFLRKAEMIEDEISDPQMRTIKIHQLVRNLRIGFLGKGSFRTVWSFEDEAIIKIIKSARYLYMNKEEASSPMQTKYPDLIPRTLQHDKDYVWFIQEKVEQMSSMDFQEIFPKAYSLLWSLSRVTERVYSGEYNIDMIMTSIATIAKYREIGDEEAVDSLMRKFAYFLWYRGAGKLNSNDPESKRQIGSAVRLVNNILEAEPSLKRLGQMAAEFNMDTTDFALRNLGYVMDEAGDKKLKVLDVSIFAKSGPGGSSDREFRKEKESKFFDTIKKFEAESKQKLQDIAGESGIYINYDGADFRFEDFEINLTLGLYSDSAPQFERAADRNPGPIYRGLTQLAKINNEKFPFRISDDEPAVGNAWGTMTVTYSFELKRPNEVESVEQFHSYLNMFSRVYVDNYAKWSKMLNDYIESTMELIGQADRY